MRLNKYGLFFCIPFVAVFTIFSLWPTIYTFMLSFGDLRGLKVDFKFIGLANFKKVLGDEYFWGSAANTFIMWGICFAPQLGLAMLMAIWLTDVKLHIRGKDLFRALFYLPNLMTAASVAMLYRSLFGYPVGPINQILQRLGIVTKAVNFLRDPWTARYVVGFMGWWMWCGQTLILMMAAITSISPSLYESAVIDGANEWQCTWRITIPLLRPMMFFVLVTSMVGGMQAFDLPFLLTGMHGEPDFKIRTMAIYMYNHGFMGRNDYSYAAAISIGMFVITIVLSFVINYITKEHAPRHSRVKEAAK